MKIAIVTPGIAPVPATKGGAVESLIEHILNENELREELDIDLYSIYEKNAEEVSKKYNKTNFIFVKPSFFSKVLDNIIYFFVKNILRKKNNMTYRNLAKRFEYIFRLKREFLNRDYEKIILENHTTLYLSLKGKNREKYNGKYYMHLHNEINSTYGCNEIANETKNVIGVSQFICESVSEKLNGYPKENFKVLYNCIDIERFNKEVWMDDISKLRDKYGIKSDDVVVIFSGRLTKEKGILELLKAFNKIDYKNIKLVIMGSYFFDSDMSSSQMDEINKLTENIKDKVIFTGYIPYSDTPKIYSIADFAVLPSMWEEPAGLTIIEAMATGLPVIATYSGGIPEYLSDEDDLLIKRDEQIIEELTKKIKLLYEDKALRVKLGEKNREKAKKFNIKSYYYNFIDILKE